MSSGNKFLSWDTFWFIISILAGTLMGLGVSYVCRYLDLFIFGTCIDIFIAPLVAGFVETYVSNYTRNKSSGAISAIILFIITNYLGWFNPANTITLSVFTVGGFLLMLQAAFPIFINYLIIALLFALSYTLAVIGGYFGLKSQKKGSKQIEDITDFEELGIHIFNSKPDCPIEKYHGLVISEDIVDFDDKSREERVEYMGSKFEDKELLKQRDYSIARDYILHNLEEEAIKVNANAIIDMEFEYTNYNGQLPPDVLIAAYGTAVTIDEKYLS
jgi:uncharacterized protein YbjQ (UPF0145 family)